MELAIGAMGPLFPKLLQLMEDKYVEQRGLKREVVSLSTEMEMVRATLVEVSKVPPERLSEQDKLWARLIRELSYDMEDAVDAFMVRVARREPSTDTNVLKRIVHMATSTVKKIKERHQISDKIKDIKTLSEKLAELRVRYKFNGDAPVVSTGVDPRVINLYNNQGRELVGIDKARDELVRMLTYPEGHTSLKIISIVGSGGLGKTTLATVVHDQLKAQPFDFCAFVSVGRNPNIRNTLREMLHKLGKTCGSDMTSWSAELFCEELNNFLQGKRYNIVVDDVWDKTTWEAISCALPDSNCGSKVIVTTRNSEEVSTKVSDVYKLQPLSSEKAKELFYKRTSITNGDNQLVDKIIGKCGGVPLAIIAIASLLADRQLEDWQTVYDSLILGCEDNTRTILLYSYYDLPPRLKPCLLYLSMYPEDHWIRKSTLIWRWIAEGFVQLQKEGRSCLFEVGERYFNELLNRSMIQPVEMGRAGIINGCRVHDIVLDLIRDLSMEENFVTILGEKQSESLESVTRKKEVGLPGIERKARRLSIQRFSTERIPEDIVRKPEVVRSLYTVDCSIDVVRKPEVVRSLYTVDCSIDVPPLSCFQACRVLAMEGKSIIGDLKDLGKLLHLRYLEISGIEDDDEPLLKEIGNLKSLQTLIIYYKIRELLPAVCELTQLMCLHAFHCVIKWPAGRMGKLVCLEELKLSVDNDSVDDFVVELGKLTRLRVLWIQFKSPFRNEATFESLMQSLNNLQEIRELRLSYGGSQRKQGAVMAWKSWEPPRQLCSLVAVDTDLSPQSLEPARFGCLIYLHLSLENMDPGDMEILALLPQLQNLSLTLRDFRQRHQGFIVGADGFKNLRVCEANTKLKFLQGAMPRLESLRCEVRPGTDPTPELEEINLATLVSLKEVVLEVDCLYCFRADVEETEAVVRRAVEYHPGRPTLQIYRFDEDGIIPDDRMKPDKVVYARLNARRDGWVQIDDDVHMRFYRWLEEITYDIDCEGSRLSQVEQIEAILRSQAATHPNRPRLLMTRINEDKLIGCTSDDHSDSETAGGAAAAGVGDR